MKDETTESLEGKVTVRLPLHLKEKFEGIAEAEGKTLSDILREGLELMDTDVIEIPEKETAHYLGYVAKNLKELEEFFEGAGKAMIGLISVSKMFLDNQKKITNVVEWVYRAGSEAEKLQKRSDNIPRLKGIMETCQRNIKVFSLFEKLEEFSAGIEEFRLILQGTAGKYGTPSLTMPLHRIYHELDVIEREVKKFSQELLNQKG